MVLEHKKKVLLLVIPVAVILLLSVVVPGAVTAEEVEEEENDTNNYIVREPIRIDGNDDFAAQAAAEGWPGDGSEGNPYVIEGYEINGTGYGYGIYVGNTTVHFVVRRCYVHNVSGIRNYPYFLNEGIQFYTVQNGNISSNIISDNEEGGIRFMEAENNIVADNYIINNYRGVTLGGSHKNVITRNIIHSDTRSPQTGIGLAYSDNNIINNNTISNHRYGIFEDTCDRNVIEDNSFADNETDYDYAYEVENGNNGDNEIPFIGFSFTVIAIMIVALTNWKKY